MSSEAEKMLNNKIKRTKKKYRKLLEMGFSASVVKAIIFIKFLLPISISAISFNYLFGIITAYWTRVPLLFDSFISCFLCAVSVGLIGILFYVLRQTKRKIYAVIEFGAGSGLAYFAANRLVEDHKTGAALATLLGCIYIIVRACDNFMQSVNKS